MARTSEIVAGLDLGSSKIACVIAEGPPSERNVIGVSMVPSEGGLRDGQVVRLDGTTGRGGFGGRTAARAPGGG